MKTELVRRRLEVIKGHMERQIPKYPEKGDEWAKYVLALDIAIINLELRETKS